jgi:hypothetical protein
VDALSRGLTIDNKNVDPSPAGYHKAVFVTATTVGTQPVETLIYASNLMKLPIAVGTATNHKIWFVENGKITKSNSKKWPDLL